MTIYDVDSVRAGFPSLASGIAHFDGPGGTQTPAMVGAGDRHDPDRPAVQPRHRRRLRAQRRRRRRRLSRRLRRPAELPAGGIVYGRSATQLTYDFSRHLAKTWRPATRSSSASSTTTPTSGPGCRLPSGPASPCAGSRSTPRPPTWSWASCDDLVNERTRLVAVTGASNLLGTRPPLRHDRRAGPRGRRPVVRRRRALRRAHHGRRAGAGRGLLRLLAVQVLRSALCRARPPTPALLETIHPDKLLPSTDMVPERFEFGTLPYEIMAGATAAVDFIAALAPDTSGTPARAAG